MPIERRTSGTDSRTASCRASRTLRAAIAASATAQAGTATAAAGERVTVSAAIPSESDPARTADAKGSAAVG